MRSVLKIISAASAFGMLGAFVVPPAAYAGITFASCSDSNNNTIACGGSTDANATPLSLESTTAINMFGSVGTQWFEFAWGGGDLTITGFVESASDYDLTLEGPGSTTLIDTVAVDSTPNYTGVLTEDALAAGDYYVGLVDAPPPSPNASLTFSSDVSPVPEPASMALLGAGLAGLGAIRRRRRG